MCEPVASVQLALIAPGPAGVPAVKESATEFGPPDGARLAEELHVTGPAPEPGLNEQFTIAPIARVPDGGLQSTADAVAEIV